MELRPESLLDLALRIETELRCSGLASGHRCPPTAELARGLRVSTKAANNALRILVKRGVLTRRQRVGTVLTERALANNTLELQRVHLMVHPDFLRTEGLLADDVIIGIQDALPGAQLRYDFIPAANVTESVERIVAEALRQSEPEGFVMVRAPLEVQRLIQTSGLPAVVYGHLQPSVTGLPQIDWDQRQIADLAAKHLLARHCRRFLVLLRRDFGPGDGVFLDRMQANLAAAGVGLSDLIVRGLPPDVDAVAQAVKPLLTNSDDPLGIICRSRPLADGVLRILTESVDTKPRASRPPRAAKQAARTTHVEAVITSVYLRQQDPTPPFPFIQPVPDAEEIGRRIGRLLAAQAAGRSGKDAFDEIPVRLQQPDRTEGDRL
jgi:DNA-binding Lrp family transcriptional regulator